MPQHRSNLPGEIVKSLRNGVVTPVHPLGLNKNRKPDKQCQRALSRHHIYAGAGNLAVGLQTTQFEVCDDGLYEPALRITAEMDGWSGRPLVQIAGDCGRTNPALGKADIALRLGYHAGLLRLTAFAGDDNTSAKYRIALYNGNNDQIVADLRTPFTITRGSIPVTIRITSGIFGHWCVWTSDAIRRFGACPAAAESGEIAPALKADDLRMTDGNAAFIATAIECGGDIAGCHEVLHRQGLLEFMGMLDPEPSLGVGLIRRTTKVG